LLASYPAIDVIASIAAALGTGASRRVLGMHAAIGALPVPPVGGAALCAAIAAALGTATSGRVLRINAAISALAVAAIGATAFGADAGATLTAFGAWAAVSGAIQFPAAVPLRRTQG